jgi:hypothetical protein
MIECASWHAVAYVGDEWAERRAQWAGTTSERLFKSGFEIAVHGDNAAVAKSGAWCNDLEGRCHTGELR